MSTLENNKQLIDIFYQGLASLDAQAMSNCYHAEAVFSDPVFGKLNYAEVTTMWQLLLRSKDLKIQFQINSINEKSAKVYWQADYVYGKNKRKIHNRIKSLIQFREGKIYRHTDKFSLWKWSGQAMGFNGTLIGWTSFFRKRLQTQSKQMLERYISKTKK